MTTFYLLSKALQRKVWDMKWERFTPIQDQAIPLILQTKQDLIICAGTASGKTEAVFLPILTAVEESAQSALKVLYISPLKALINNQFERIEKLCEYMDIFISRWHGDVSASKKQQFLKNPTGILQITPESIESLFINRPNALKKLFGEVEYIVIDEIHAFIDTERGVHLRSLLSRIEEIPKKKPRIIGLSATIGNFDVVKSWVNKESQHVEVIEDKDSDKTLLYNLMYFDAEKTGVKPLELFEDIRALTTENKAIIFCNSRASVEETTILLNRLAETETYYAHHGSIDKKEREYVEQMMMETTFPKSVVATSSLELGVDIGDVDLVIQVDSTFSVSSLKQRLGRSGRKVDSEQILQLYATHPDSLLQSLAVMELILEKWVEPATGYLAPYDILVQQVISLCAQENGLTLAQLMEKIRRNQGFLALEASKVQAVIEALIQQNLLEQLKGREELIVGIEGERLLRRQDFYSVFTTTEEYEVLDQSQKVGKIHKVPQLAVGDNIMLAGKLWAITKLDSRRNKCHVEPAITGEAPKFLSSGGKIHQRLGEKMMEVLCENKDYEYLDPLARDVLEDLRCTYELNEVKVKERIVLKDRNEYVFETFTSTKIATTIFWMLRSMGVRAYGLDALGRITFKYDKNVSSIFRDLKKYKGTEYELLELKKVRETFESKYSPYLPSSLVDEQHIKHTLDLEATLTYLKGVKIRIL